MDEFTEQEIGLAAIIVARRYQEIGYEIPGNEILRESALSLLQGTPLLIAVPGSAFDLTAWREVTA